MSRNIRVTFLHEKFTDRKKENHNFCQKMISNFFDTQKPFLMSVEFQWLRFSTEIAFVTVKVFKGVKFI